MRWKCPHCGQPGIGVQAKLAALWRDQIQCARCSLSCRTGSSFLLGLIGELLVWIAIVVVIVVGVRTGSIGVALAAGVILILAGGVAMQLIAPLRTSHQAYEFGFGLARYVARVRGVGRGK